MFRLCKYTKPIYGLIVFLIICLVITQVFCDLTMPEKLQNILTNSSLISSLREQTNINPDILANAISNAKEQIWLNALYMGLLALGSVSCTILVCFFSAKFAANFSYGVRKEVYVKAVGIQGAAKLSTIVIIAIVALICLVITIFIIVLPKFNVIQKLTDRLNLVTRENLTGLRVVRACNAMDEEELKFKKANDNITKNNIFVNRVFSIFMPGMQIIMNFASLLILWIGGFMVFDLIGYEAQATMLGSIFTFQQYTMMIVMGFMQLTMIVVLVPRGIVSAKRINEILDSKTLINDPQNPIKEFDLKGEVEFKNVNFSYNKASEEVLENINFKINKGETLAIIGGTGSGKSSLVNLIARFYDVTNGEVLVDGVNVKDFTQEELRAKIGFVPQKAVLFSGTIRSNLAFGKNDLNDEDIKEALDIAQATEFVNEIGYDAPVAQGGSNFSGGQKQRLCIARAIIKKPEILVFDDSFSALDLKTDQKLREALALKTKGTTNIIVAQRIGTILNADKIIVLDDGKMVGYGNHQELLKNCKVYQEIAYSQLSKEELENA